MRHEGANSDGVLSDVIDQCPSPRFGLFDWTENMGTDSEVPAEKCQLGPLVSHQTCRIHFWFVHYSTAAVKDVKNAFAALHLAWERGHSIREPSRVKYGK